MGRGEDGLGYSVRRLPALGDCEAAPGARTNYFQFVLPDLTTTSSTHFRNFSRSCDDRGQARFGRTIPYEIYYSATRFTAVPVVPDPQSVAQLVKRIATHCRCDRTNLRHGSRLRP
jgi:hypothetical protein